MDGYESIKLIGRGAYGDAILCKQRSDGSSCVVKQIRLESGSKSSGDRKSGDPQHQLKQLKNEVEILVKCGTTGHPNIIRYRTSFIDASAQQLCIVMDWYGGGDLQQKIKLRKTHFQETEILDFFVQLCFGLKHIHDHKVLHRDLKASNIFIDRTASGIEVLKIGDFGISKILSHTNQLSTTRIGTPYYLSPEVCEGRPYNTQTDIWSLGCVLYEMCALVHAFSAQRLDLLTMKILRGQFPPIPKFYSDSLRQLVSALLAQNPSDRPTVYQLLELPFLQKRIQKWKAVVNAISTPNPIAPATAATAPTAARSERKHPIPYAAAGDHKATPAKKHASTAATAVAGVDAAGIAITRRAPPTPIITRRPSAVRSHSPVSPASSPLVSSPVTAIFHDPQWREHERLPSRDDHSRSPAGVRSSPRPIDGVQPKEIRHAAHPPPPQRPPARNLAPSAPISRPKEIVQPPHVHRMPPRTRTDQSKNSAFVAPAAANQQPQSVVLAAASDRHQTQPPARQPYLRPQLQPQPQPPRAIGVSLRSDVPISGTVARPLVAIPATAIPAPPVAHSGVVSFAAAGITPPSPSPSLSSSLSERAGYRRPTPIPPPAPVPAPAPKPDALDAREQRRNQIRREIEYERQQQLQRQRQQQTVSTVRGPFQSPLFRAPPPAASVVVTAATPSPPRPVQAAAPLARAQIHPAPITEPIRSHVISCDRHQLLWHGKARVAAAGSEPATAPVHNVRYPDTASGGRRIGDGDGDGDGDSDGEREGVSQPSRALGINTSGKEKSGSEEAEADEWSDEKSSRCHVRMKTPTAAPAASVYLSFSSSASSLSSVASTSSGTTSPQPQAVITASVSSVSSALDPDGATAEGSPSRPLASSSARAILLSPAAPAAEDLVVISDSPFVSPAIVNAAVNSRAPSPQPSPQPSPCASPLPPVRSLPASPAPAIDTVTASPSAVASPAPASVSLSPALVLHADGSSAAFASSPAPSVIRHHRRHRRRRRRHSRATANDSASNSDTESTDSELDDTVAAANASLETSMRKESADKFHLYDRTLQLSNVKPNDSISFRIENLRLFLEKRLPLVTLLRCYSLLKSVTSDDDEQRVAAAVLALVTDHERPYITLIQQLIVCEERAYDVHL